MLCTYAETVLELFEYHNLHHAVSGFSVLAAPIIRTSGPTVSILSSKYAEYMKNLDLIGQDTFDQRRSRAVDPDRYYFVEWTFSQTASFGLISVRLGNESSTLKGSTVNRRNRDSSSAVGFCLGGFC